MQYILYSIPVVIVILIIILYFWIHSDDIHFAKKKSNYEYTEELLYAERAKLTQLYNDLKGTMNEVSGDAWDIVYREYKCIEEALEINRERFKLLKNEGK